MNPSSVTEAEISAYLDGELDLERKLAVETHLANDPEAAARFVEDLRAGTVLRILSAEQTPVPARMQLSATLLSRRLQARPNRFLKPFAALAAVVALSIVVPLSIDTSADARPAYVADAVNAYETGLLRATMASQVETPRLDIEEIRSHTRVKVPSLPAGWTITDVQVFPSEEGPAVQIMIDAGGPKPISLFAVHAPSDAPTTPVAIRDGDASVAYWQTDGIAYALTGAVSLEQLDSSADRLTAVQPADPRKPS